MENFVKAHIYDTVESNTYHVIDDIEVIGNIGVVDHNSLQNLDYEHSGHIGFASSAALQAHTEAINPHNITCETIGAASIQQIQQINTNITNHIEAVNPHHITCEMIGAAPANMIQVPQIPISTINANKGYIYVDNDGQQGKVSVNDIKEMNTKIISADSEADERISKLSTDDFVYIKNN